MTTADQPARPAPALPRLSVPALPAPALPLPALPAPQGGRTPVRLALRERPAAPSAAGAGRAGGSPRRGQGEGRGLTLRGGRTSGHGGSAGPGGRGGRGGPGGGGGRGGGRSRVVGAVLRLHARVMRAWDRPLTAYYVILGGSLLITLLGLVMVFSASQIQALGYGLPATYYFRKQLVAAALGTVAMLLASRLQVRLMRALAYPMLAGSVVLLALVQVPGLGVEVNGNQSWLRLGGPFLLQPSEFGKLALVVWGADLLARKGDKRLLDQWKHLLVPLVPAAFLVFGLVMLGGDMGTVVILAAILFGLLWLAGAPTRLFITVLAGAAALALPLIVGSAHRMARLSCIATPEPDPEHCWQAVHGTYALASGGWFGSGLGASMEKWGELPEPHTDFIFAVTGEELGLAGTLSVIGLFAALGYAGIRVAGRTEDPFVRYATGGMITWITSQVIINVGSVLGLLPIAGVPLPLFSYGGSALLTTMFAVGLLIAFARSDPAVRAVMAARQPAVKRKLAGVTRNTMGRPVNRRPSGER